MKKHNLLLISVDSPILLGIYENKKLVKSYKKEGKFSDSLPQLFSEVFAFINKTKERPEKKQTINLHNLLPQDKFGFDIYYANGPGNFSAIKLTHIFLQTLQISLDTLYRCKFNTAESISANQICLFCTDAFHFSDSEFINAYGKIHFYKVGSIQSGVIQTITLETKYTNSFSLPNTLDTSIFSDKCTPLYILPAV